MSRSARAGGDGTVTLWDVTDRNEGRPLGEPLLKAVAAQRIADGQDELPCVS
jgi:hypothetical protein